MYKPKMKGANSSGVGKLMGKVLRLFRVNADTQASSTGDEATDYEYAFVGAHTRDPAEIVRAMMYAESKRAMALEEWQRNNRPY